VPLLKMPQNGCVLKITHTKIAQSQQISGFPIMCLLLLCVVKSSGKVATPTGRQWYYSHLAALLLLSLLLPSRLLVLHSHYLIANIEYGL